MALLRNSLILFPNYLAMFFVHWRPKTFALPFQSPSSPLFRPVYLVTPLVAVAEVPWPQTVQVAWFMHLFRVVFTRQWVRNLVTWPDLPEQANNPQGQHPFGVAASRAVLTSLPWLVAPRGIVCSVWPTRVSPYIKLIRLFPYSS